MTAQEYAFLVLAAVGSVSAIAVVTARNVVHAALYLVVTLLSVGSVYLLLGAEFTGWVQILIYVGAIVILFLFGLMLTKAPIGRDTLDNQQRWVGVAVAAGVFVGLVFLIQQAWPMKDAQNTYGVYLGEHGRDRRGALPLLRPAVRGDLVPAPRGADRRHRAGAEGRRRMIRLPFILFFSALLFSAGVYGVLARRNAIMVLMAIELMLNAVNVNLVGFSAYLKDVTGQVFALFVIAVAAAEVGIGLAIVILLFRNRESINVDEVNLLKW